MFVCALGDLLLDAIVRLDAPLSPGDDVTAATALRPGGQAANVAAWAAALGARSRIVAVRGDDDAAAIAVRGFAERGVDVCGPVRGRTGVVVALVEPGGSRTMASDRGAAPELRPDDLSRDWFACDALHLSGYSLMRDPIASAAIRAAELAREHNARVSVDLSSWTHIERFGDAMRSALTHVAPDVIFGNEREWQAIGEVEARTRVVKRGARGIIVDGREHEAERADVVDTTGAGDALAAGFLVGGVELALSAAARCIAHVGAMP
jgi:sugar/nucleoside kinase (ribokinase family)